MRMVEPLVLVSRPRSRDFGDGWNSSVRQSGARAQRVRDVLARRAGVRGPCPVIWPGVSGMRTGPANGMSRPSSAHVGSCAPRCDDHRPLGDEVAPVGSAIPVAEITDRNPAFLGQQSEVCNFVEAGPVAFGVGLGRPGPDARPFRVLAAPRLDVPRRRCGGRELAAIKTARARDAARARKTGRKVNDDAHHKASAPCATTPPSAATCARPPPGGARSTGPRSATKNASTASTCSQRPTPT